MRVPHEYGMLNHSSLSLELYFTFVQNSTHNVLDAIHTFMIKRIVLFNSIFLFFPFSYKLYILQPAYELKGKCDVNFKMKVELIFLV
jgi:hypothetical protein